MSTIPRYLESLVDDAALFPPRESLLADAVCSHLHHRTSAHAPFVGPFVVTTSALGAVAGSVATHRPHTPMPLCVVSSLSAAGIRAAVAAAAGVAPNLHVEVAALELRADPSRQLVEQVHFARQTRTRLVDNGSLPAGAPVFVELPRPGLDPAADWQQAADAVASSCLRFKFRTGGVTAADFPNERELGHSILAAVQRGARFKCTAGLHNAIRHDDPATGFRHHGFLNVLVSSYQAGAGADLDDIVATLAQRDASAVAAEVPAAQSTGLTEARRWFASYGSCSVEEPLADLLALGLLPDLSDVSS